MNKFIILAAVAAVAVAEAPAHVGLSGGYSGGGGSSLGGSSFGGSSGGSGINEYVDEALLARVGDLISRGGDGTGTPQGSEGRNIDASILSRVSGSLGDSGSSSGPSSSYGPPSRSSGPATLGNPEPAQRIAEFDLSDTRGSTGSQGGYSGSAPSAPAQQPSSGYGAPTRGGSSSGGPISLGRPEPAQRVADFSVSGQGQGAPAQRGGYN